MHIKLTQEEISLILEALSNFVLDGFIESDAEITLLDGLFAKLKHEGSNNV